jgi:hypothetical protein
MVASSLVSRSFDFETLTWRDSASNSTLRVFLKPLDTIIKFPQ